MTAPALPDDGRDLIDELIEAGVDFLVVGAHALAVHGVSRGTADLDLLVRPTDQNAARVVEALRRFGAPLRMHGVSESDFVRVDTVYQLGLPPNRIDVLTGIDGVTFAEAWAGRVVQDIDGVPVPFIGREALLTNKRSTGRTKDLADVEALEAVE